MMASPTCKIVLFFFYCGQNSKIGYQLICEHRSEEEVITGKTRTKLFFPLTLFHSKFLYQGNVINVWSPLKQLTYINLVDCVEIHKTHGDF